MIKDFKLSWECLYLKWGNNDGCVYIGQIIAKVRNWQLPITIDFAFPPSKEDFAKLNFDLKFSQYNV